MEKINKIKQSFMNQNSIADEFQHYEEYCEMEDIEPSDSGNLDVFLQSRNRGPEYDKAMRNEFNAWYGNMTGFDGNDELIISKKNKMNKEEGLNAVFAGSVEDSTDVWKSVRQYMLNRIKERYDTTEEMNEDINNKFKSVMQNIQGQFDNWFENEIQANPSVYNIEILGGDEIVNEKAMDLNGDDEEIINENEMNDSEDDINLDEEEGF